jgi:hypothetical protein
MGKEDEYFLNRIVIFKEDVGSFKKGLSGVCTADLMKEDVFSMWFFNYSLEEEKSKGIIEKFVRFESSARDSVEELQYVIEEHKVLADLWTCVTDIFGDEAEHNKDIHVLNMATSFLYRLVSEFPSINGLDVGRTSYENGDFYIYAIDDSREFTMALKFSRDNQMVDIVCDNLAGTIPNNRIEVNFMASISEEVSKWFEKADEETI